MLSTVEVSISLIDFKLCLMILLSGIEPELILIIILSEQTRALEDHLD